MTTSVQLIKEHTGLHHHSLKSRIHKVSLWDRERIDKELSDPRIKKFLKSSFKEDHTYDIPYVAGSSKDGSIVYYDRHFPQFIYIAGKKIDAWRSVRKHERTEKALTLIKGWIYQPAHEVATADENLDVEDQGGDFRLYELAMKKYIKAIGSEKIQRVPHDLDLLPYEDTDAHWLLKKMLKKEI